MADSSVVQVQVNNINERPIIEPDTFRVPELSPVDTVVGTVTATDPEGDTLTYSIIDELGLGQNEEPTFRIDSETGAIYVASDDQDALDFEWQPTHQVKVAVSDGTYSSTQTFTITVSDVGEVPEFAEPNRSSVVAGIKLGTIAYEWASDGDFDPLYYSFTAANSQYTQYFTYNNDGELKLAKVPPKELVGTVATLQLTASDHQDGIATKMIDVTFTNVSVSVTGDFKAIESSSDGKNELVVTFVRSASEGDLLTEMEVEFTIAATNFWDSDLREDVASASFDFDTDFESNADLDALKSGKVTFAEGETEKTLTLTVVNDGIVERLEEKRLQITERADLGYAVDSVDVKVKKLLDGGGSALLQILDGVTLFAADNQHADLRDEHAHGISINDINQGGIGNCWCLTVVSSIAANEPDFLNSIIRKVGDEIFEVDLYQLSTIGEDGKPFINGDTTFTPTTVTVNLDLSRGSNEIDITGDFNSNGEVEVWTSVLEQAVAQLYGWRGIDGNHGHVAWGILKGTQNGVERVRYNGNALGTFNDIKAALEEGKQVYYSTKGIFGPNDINEYVVRHGGYMVSGHAYSVRSVNGNVMTLFNPWGIDREVKIFADELDATIYEYITFE